MLVVLVVGGVLPVSRNGCMKVGGFSGTLVKMVRSLGGRLELMYVGCTRIEPWIECPVTIPIHSRFDFPYQASVCGDIHQKVVWRQHWSTADNPTTPGLPT